MSKTKLLVIDYEPRSLDKTLDELKSEPYEIVSAKDGLDALEKFNSEEPDLILLRAMLPRKHGFQVCQEIKSSPKGKRTPVIMHTSVYRGRKYKTDALKVYGADEYLEHPLDMDKVRSLLATFARGERPSLSHTPIPVSPAPAKPEPKAKPVKKIDEVDATVVMSKEDFDPGQTLMLPPEEKPAPKKEVSVKAPPMVPAKQSAAKPPKKSVDQMLESTLAGISAPKKSSKKSAADVNKMLEATLAGVAPSKKVAAKPAPKPDSKKASAPPEKKPVPEEPKKVAPVEAAAEKPEAKKEIEKPEPVKKAPEAEKETKKAVEPAPPKPTEGAAEPDDSTVSSEDLFSDIIDEVESPSETAAKVPEPVKPVQKIKPAPAKSASVLDHGLEKKLYETLSGVKTAGKAGKKKASGAEQLEKKLSDTLSGLKIKGVASVSTEKAETSKAEEKKKAPAPAVPAKEEGLPFGPYVLLDKIATGGMAEIFKAKQKGMEGFQKIVAIKRILPHMSSNDEFVTMFVDEAKVAAQLSHPNIAQIFDLGKAEDYHYIAMEYVDGEDLKNVLKAANTKKSRMPVNVAAYIASKVAAALHYAHTKKDFEGKNLNLVHRDVSPQNLMVSTDGDLKLVDFGIAKAESKIANTQAGALKGKLLYMSPEQAWGKDLDHRSDIFSLGVVLWELLIGERLFMGDSEMGILEKVRHADIQDIREIRKDVPDGLWTIMKKALAKERDDRYMFANALHHDLDRFLYAEFRTLPTAFDLLSYFHTLMPEAYTQERLKEIEQAVAEAPPPEPPPAAIKPEAPEVIKEEEASPANEEPEPAKEIAEEKPKKKIGKKGRKGKLKKKAIKVAGSAPEPGPKKSKKPSKQKSKPAPQKRAAVVKEEDLAETSADEMVAKMDKSSPLPMIIGVLVVAAVAVWWFFLRTKPPVDPAPTPEATVETPAEHQPESTDPEAEANPEAEPAIDGTKNEGPSKREESIREGLEQDKEFQAAKKIASSSLMRAKKSVKAADNIEVQTFAPDELIEAKHWEETARTSYRKAKTPGKMGKVAADADRADELARKAVTTAKKRAKNDKDAATRLAEAEAKKPEPVAPEPAVEKPAPEPEKPSITAGQIVPLYELDMPTKPKKTPEPRIPPGAKNRNVTGKVTVKALVDVDGKVIDAKLVKGIQNDLGLNNACLDAIRKSTFNKPTAGGIPVKVWMSYTFHFK